MCFLMKSLFDLNLSLNSKCKVLIMKGYYFHDIFQSSSMIYCLGISYSAAVPYVFGVPFMNETILNETYLVPRQWYDYEDRNMSEWMMHLWRNFMYFG